MIDNFPDHSANERTFLSWVRTAISIVGFGLVVEKVGDGGSNVSGINWTGMALLVLGMVMVLGAGLRFLVLRAFIRSGKVESATPVVLDVSLAVVLIFLIAALIGFGIHVANIS